MLNGRRLVRETRGGEPYEYYALGEYVVVAPGVCGGRPTFKGTRLEVQVILDLIAHLNHERGLTVGLVCHHLPRIRSLVHATIWVEEGGAAKRALDDLPAIAPLEVAG